MNTIISFFRDYVAWLTIPDFTITDVLEIAIIAFAFYHIILWIKDTRAWVLLKGMVILGIIFLVALVLEMNVVLWVFQNAMVVGIMALVVIFQPELRNALEQLGRKKILSSLTFDNQKSKNERYSAESIEAVIKAVYDMARVKTGALIVVEKEIQCREYERTGIPIGAKISSQLLVNIFEHNTPLHDGAVIVRGNRVVSATCYLPLSDSLSLSKDLGTRHRAAVGVSEVSDSLTIIVSEETGSVSTAYKGQIEHDIDADHLRTQLKLLQNRHREPGKFELIKRRFKNGKEASKNLHK